MSTDTSIRMELAPLIHPSLLLGSMVNHGWGLDIDGTFSFFGPTNHFACEWNVAKDGSIDKLLNWSRILEETDGQFGVVLVHKPSGIGGPFACNDRRTLHWGISINIPYIFDNKHLVDFSKCLSILWPALMAAQLNVIGLHCYADR